MVVGDNSLNMKQICYPPMPCKHMAKLPHGIKVKNPTSMLGMQALTFLRM